MYKYLILSSLVLISSCSLGSKPEPTPAPVEPVKTTQMPVETSSGSLPKNAMISLQYVLHEDAPNGKIIDTSREDVAKTAGLYKSGATYSPFEVTLGTRQVVPGFEAGIKDMKKGERKTFPVAPKDGYGEARTSQVVSKYQVAPEFTVTTSKDEFQDVVTKTIERSQLGEAGKDIKVGQSLTGGLNIVAKVVKIDGEAITIEIDNKENPFFKKKLSVGATAEQNGLTYKVLALSDTGVTMNVTNPKSPFAGKKFEAGTTAMLPDPTGGSGVELKILSLSGETVTLEVPNQHPLAGKTLYFDVEILDIK